MSRRLLTPLFLLFFAQSIEARALEPAACPSGTVSRSQPLGGGETDELNYDAGVPRLVRWTPAGLRMIIGQVDAQFRAQGKGDRISVVDDHTLAAVVAIERRRPLADGELAKAEADLAPKFCLMLSPAYGVTKFSVRLVSPQGMHFGDLVLTPANCPADRH